MTLNGIIGFWGFNQWEVYGLRPQFVDVEGNGFKMGRGTLEWVMTCDMNCDDWPMILKTTFTDETIAEEASLFKCNWGWPSTFHDQFWLWGSS
jgi:hypothetical protein